MENGGKTDLPMEKKLSDFDRIISLPNAENSAQNLSKDGRDPSVYFFQSLTPGHCLTEKG